MLIAQAQQISNFQNGQKVALYLANDGEINPEHIKDFLKNEGIMKMTPRKNAKSSAMLLLRFLKKKHATLMILNSWHKAPFTTHTGP